MSNFFKLLFLQALLIPFQLHAQSVRHPFSFVIDDIRFEKSQLAIPLFALKNDSIQLEKNTAAPGEGPWTQVIFPNFGSVKDTAFGYFPFNGAGGKSPGFVPILVTNVRHRQLGVQIWKDKNGNFDFSDDGEPDLFPKDKRSIHLGLSESQMPDISVSLKLSFFQFEGQEKYREMLREYYLANYPDRIFLGSEYCFRYQPYRLRGVKISDCGDPMIVSVFDVDFNGRYSPESDRIIVEDPDRIPIETDEDVQHYPVFQKNNAFQFRRKGCLFEVSKIDPTLKYIEIKVIANDLGTGLQKGKKPGKFKIKTWDNKKLSHRKYKKTPSYFYIFHFENLNYYLDTPYIRKIYEEFGQKLKITMLYYGKSPKIYRNYAGLKQYPWVMGFSSATINRKFYIEDIPQGVLFKKNLRCLQGSIRPQELYEWLKLHPEEL